MPRHINLLNLKPIYYPDSTHATHQIPRIYIRTLQQAAPAFCAVDSTRALQKRRAADLMQIQPCANDG